jgi:hypothetical protein
MGATSVTLTRSSDTWDSFDAIELLMLYGMFERSYAKVASWMHMYDATMRDGAQELRRELGHEAIELYQTLITKLETISDADEYIDMTYDIMGPRKTYPV